MTSKYAGTWTLDTCGCVFITEVDVSLPEIEQTVQLASASVLKQIGAKTAVLKDCGLHGSQTPQALFMAVKEENQRRMRILVAIAEQAGITREKYAKGNIGNMQYSDALSEVNSKIAVTWEQPDIDGVRTLHVHVDDSVLKGKIQDTLPTLAFGAVKFNKIVIE